MTVVSVKVENKSDRIARVRKEWVNEAAEYFFSIGVFQRDGESDERACYDISESIYENCMQKDGSIELDVYDPVSAVKEELSYWGD